MAGTPDVLSGTFAGRYTVDRELGRGATATVYLARDTQRGITVAIKVLKPELAESVGAERFLREIKVNEQLHHPHIVEVLDSGQHDGQLYFVLPQMEGGSLRQMLQREKQLPIEVAVSIARTIADALDYAHKQKLIHRDVKPENILFTSGQACLADFGIARAIERAIDESTTETGLVRGTPAYMSPEQASGSKLYDGRSDTYSLACVLYEMLAGVPAFIGPTPEAVIAQRFQHPPRELRVYRPNVPPAVETVLRKALQISAADRYTTVAEFSAALESALRAPRPEPRTSGSSTGAPSRWFYNATFWWTLAGIVFAGLAVSRYFVRAPIRENDWLLVADFDGPKDESRLTEGVRDLTTHAFKQSRFVQVFDRRQLNEVMRRANLPETSHVDVSRARELALRSSVRAVVRGGVRRLDSTTLELVLHVVRADNGGSLASAVGTASVQTLPDIVQSLVRYLRERLGEQRSAITANRPLRQVTTPSFQAFLKYSAALDALSLAADYARSNVLASQAVALDSGFASAWALMGTNYVTLRQPDSARLAFARALALPERLSAAEVYRLRGDVAYALDHDIPASVKWYDLYLAEIPNSRSGRANRAVYRSAIGQWEEAVADLREAVALNPFGVDLIQPTLLNLSAALVVVGKTEEARRIRENLSGAPADYMDIMFAAAASQWPRAESIATRVAGDTATQGVYRINALTARAGATAAQGAVGVADSLLRVASQGSRGSVARWYERQRLLLAIVTTDSATRRGDLVPGDTTPAAQMLRALWSAVAGDTVSARAVLRTLRSPSPPQAAVLGFAPALVDGWIAARRKDWRYVVDHLGSAALLGEHDPTILDRPDSFQLRWLVALAYQRLDRPDSAATYLELLLRPTRMPTGHFALRGIPFGFAHLRLAEIQAANRHPDAARRHLDAVIPAFTRTDAEAQQRITGARNAYTQLMKARSQ